jgi:nanoRNase/pAp phosphatase (c-di-AMP/oligoRNAs hydrolase)
MACAYIDHHPQNDNTENDVILQDAFSTNLVLIWSFVDALNPRVSVANFKGTQIVLYLFINEIKYYL